MMTSPLSETSPKSDPKGARPADSVASQSGGAPLASLNSAIFSGVNVALRAKLGELTLTVEDLLTLKAGAVVKLDAALNDLVELQLNDSVVARGELVAVGDHFGIRIVEIAQNS